MIYIYIHILLGTRSIGIRMNFKHWFLVLPTHWAAGAGLAAPVINETVWVVAAVPFCAVLEQWGGHACHLGGEDGEMGSHWLRCDVYICLLYYVPYNLILGLKMGRRWIHNLVNSSCRSNNFGICFFPCCESVNHSPQLTSVYSPQLTSVPPESRKKHCLWSGTQMKL